MTATIGQFPTGAEQLVRLLETAAADEWPLGRDGLITSDGYDTMLRMMRAALRFVPRLIVSGEGIDFASEGAERAIAAIVMADPQAPEDPDEVLASREEALYLLGLLVGASLVTVAGGAR